MKSALTAVLLTLAPAAFALDGQPFIHDPSTVIECDGKYYAFGTGGNGIMSEDGGWTWHGGAVRPGGGVAPDAIKIGDRYLVSYGGGGGIHTMWTKTLDPASADFQDDTLVAGGDMDCNPIDPAFLFDPTTGKLWVTYGSYVGYIRLLELDPHTAKPVPGATPFNIAIDCEASCMIYHDGWYYLLATHGSCCQGANSGYHIIVGRSQKVTGPFLDNMGVDMLQGGGKLFFGSQGRWIGAGHFGLLALGDDAAQKWSCHYEADLDKGGSSVLEIRPMLWRDGWPVAGDNLVEGSYEVQSARTGTSLELAVQGLAVGGGRGRGGGGGGRGGFGRGAGGAPGAGAPPAGAGVNVPGGAVAPVPSVNVAAPGADAAATNGGGRRAGGGRGGGGGGFGRGGGGPIPAQDVAQVSTNWPTGNIDPRLGNYMCQAQQKWAFTAVTNVGGYLGSPFFKITVAGTDRALAATADAELVTVPAFTGAPEQLWQVDELTDGTWRIMPKAIPGSTERLALSAIGSRFATLAKFDSRSDRQRWLLRKP